MPQMPTFSAISRIESQPLRSNRPLYQADRNSHGTYGVSAERAFEVLAWRSKETNVKLRHIAEQFVREVSAFHVSHTPARLSTVPSARVSANRQLVRRLTAAIADGSYGASRLAITVRTSRCWPAGGRAPRLAWAHSGVETFRDRWEYYDAKSGSPLRLKKEPVEDSLAAHQHVWPRACRARRAGAQRDSPAPGPV